MNEPAEELVRRELAHALHDGPLQTMAGAKLMLEALAYQSRSGRLPTADDLARPLKLIGMAMVELRELVQETRPLPHDEDWSKRLRDWLKAIPAGDTIEIEISETLPPVTGILREAIYRISCEGLRNALQHAQAKRIRLKVTNEGTVLHWEVTDDGIGFDPRELPEKHFGVKGMKERIDGIGGQFFVHSQPGVGTRLTAWIPLQLPTKAVEDNQP
jgi:two-component system NarL family sensor kinase